MRPPGKHFNREACGTGTSVGEFAPSFHLGYGRDGWSPGVEQEAKERNPESSLNSSPPTTDVW